MNGIPSISASGLTKRFGKITAVDGLSFDIYRGEIYGFLGLNGAGKTTTIRMLLGMISPDAGGVSLFGTMVKPDRRDIWRRVGYLVETPNAYPNLTVRENLEITARLRKLSDSGAVSGIIRELGLTQYAGRPAGTLSLGNAQRLGMAKALIHRPDLLMLDEPANALDPAGIVEIRNLLRGLAEKNGTTIFISSHILSEIARLATRVGIIHEGRLIKELDGTQLAGMEEPRLSVTTRDIDAARFVLEKAGFTVIPDGKDSLTIMAERAVQHPDDIAVALVQAGYPPTRLAVERVDLETYFLGLVGREVQK